jgi:hypothetical protein
MRTYELTDTLLIDREKFLDWYLNERGDFIAMAYSNLLNFREFSITQNDMLESMQNKPIDEKLLVKGQKYVLDEYGDVDTYHVKLILN